MQLFAAVPWEAVRYTLAPATHLSKDLKYALHAVWMASRTNSMLYGVTLRRNHITRSGMVRTLHYLFMNCCYIVHCISHV